VGVPRGRGEEGGQFSVLCVYWGTIGCTAPYEVGLRPNGRGGLGLETISGAGYY
jgi:hypothetical protein